MTQWKFHDALNVAVFTTRQVLEGDWIAYVSHDLDDGAWQFHHEDMELLNENDGVVVGLQEILRLDPSIEELADLPLGWRAWRASTTSPWQRMKIG